MAEDQTGISVAVLKGQNYSASASASERPHYIAPDMSQDHLEALEGDFGAHDVVVQHNDGGGREVVRGLPGGLQASPHN